MSLELLIIADDCTGAVDTAVQFSKKGIPNAVYLSADNGILHLDNSPEVVAVATESRHLPQADAYGRVKAVVEKAMGSGCRRFYKKIDSTFRGNVGAELEALMAAAGASCLMLVPAYPDGGRTTRNGLLYVNGKPLHESAFCRDPREPATESFIPAILARQTSLTVHTVGRISGMAAAELQSGIFLFDAGTNRDLRAIGGFLDKKGMLDVVAGSAGFAEILAGLYYTDKAPAFSRGMNRLSQTRESPRSSSEHRGRPTGGGPPESEATYGDSRKQRCRGRRSAPLFVVNGSLHDVSLGQVEQARQEGTACFLVPPAAVRDSLTDSIARRLQESGCAVLTTGTSEQGIVPSDMQVETIGRIAAAAIKTVPDASVAVFGGDTAAAVCRCLGCEALYPAEEIMPGLTVCSAGTPSGRRIVLKSGGFGSREVIRKIQKYLKTRI